ncbi:protein TASOR 2 isoform X4 [Tamandua tetradactyla]|uniref:protein TASOR 2 isoform X4 n=1 Tax=Tamandua tetradactyla TaxID=48850 RepID=UPI00405396B9
MGKKLNSNLKSSGAAAAQSTVFETVSLSSDSVFQRAVSILHTSYLDSASEHGFQYSQVTLVKNDIFLNEYKTFYQQKKASDYTQEELQETYGFLLFETENQARLVCQRGLCVGSSAITTLGDPAKGVYISKYSDYLHPRPWYHGKSGYVVIFNLIKGKVKFVPENYTTNYTKPSSGYDCHEATNSNEVSHKTSRFRAFELSQYYIYELSDSTFIERPRQICPYVIVAFQYREPKTMAAAAHKSMLELSEDVLISPWKGKLIIQSCLLCDITLWSTYAAVLPTQLPQELEFQYVMKVSSLKKILPEAAFRKQNYLEQKVYHQDMCFNLYEVELSNRQGEKIDKLTEYMKLKGLAIIKCLEDRGFFILLTSSALTSDTDFEDERIGLHGLHLFHSSLSTGTGKQTRVSGMTGMKDFRVEDGISLKVIPILPALNCALLEAKKSFTEDGIRPNTLVKHNFQEFYRVDKSPSLTASSEDGIKETTLFGKLSNGFDLLPPAEKCPLQSLIQLKSYFSDPSSYVLEVSTALDLLAERPQSPCISDGICDAGFSLVMTPDPEFLDSEAEVRKEAETEKNSEDIFKAKKEAMVPVSSVSNLRVQPKRKASMPLGMQSKRVNLCHPFPKRTASGTNNETIVQTDSATTLKLAKGQFPQKRKRGAEVLTAQFVQTTKLDRKNQEAPISKDVPVATNTKRARKQEKSPVKTVPKAKPSVKKSPQKQRVNIVKGNQNPRIRKQPQPAKGESTSQLQSEVSSNGQGDVFSLTTAQSENTTVAQKDLPENSIVSYDSQALNMLADLALSSATSPTPTVEPRNLPCSSVLPQNEVLLSKENLLRGTSDHEYHRGVKSQKGGVFPKQSSDKKNNSVSDLTVRQDEESLVPSNQVPPVKAQSALMEETLETSDSSQSSFVAVEHSYALLAEHSKKHLQHRGVLGPVFAKNGTKGPEAGTPVGKVVPFRHQQNTSPLQKPFEDPFIKHKSRLTTSSLKDFFCSHTVFYSDGSFKVTFKCETEYVFSLDSKYTNNPLEKTIIRALHGPWNTDLPDNVEEVKLLLHMWVALFYSNQNKVIRSSRKVVEHSNPAKYVSINSTLESFEFSEIEESLSLERCSTDPLLETNETSKDEASEMSFPDTNSLLPFNKSPAARDLELCVQNEQKEIFVKEGHPDNPESQNFICSCNNEVNGKKAEQESSDKLKTSHVVLSSVEITQTNGPSVPGEDRTFQQLDNTRVTSHNDANRQTTFTNTYGDNGSQSVICQKSVYSTLESKVDILHAGMQAKTSALQDLIKHSNPINKDCQPSLERKGDNMGYVMINLEPVTLTFEKNAYVPIQTEVVNRSDVPTAFNMEVIKQASPTISLRHPISTFEKAQAQGLRDMQSLTVSGQKGTKYLCASSVSGETHAKDTCSLQKDIPLLDSSSPSDKTMVMEAVSIVKNSSYPLPSEETRLSQDFFLQTQGLFSISSEEIIEPSQVEEVISTSASNILEKNFSLNCIPDSSLVLRKNDKTVLNSENMNSESFNSAFTKQTNLSMNREEVNLELSEEDSDIDLTLTISPPTSPREQMPVDEVDQLEEALLSNSELQDMAEEIIEPEEVTFIENREVEVNSTAYTSVHPAVSEEPLENESKSDDLQPVTLVVSKDNCSLEIAGEVNVTSAFPFNSLIEEVSPAASPDPQFPTEETQPSQAVSPGSLKVHDTECKKSNKFSQIESIDLAITEKENSFVGLPAYSVRQDNLTWVQLSAEMPLILSNHPGRKDSNLTLPGKLTEEIVQNEHDEVLPFSEKVQCCDAEVNQPSSAARCDDFMPSLAKRVKSGRPLQPTSIENRNLGLKHLVLETPRKMTENKSLGDIFLSTTAPSDIVSMSLKQQTSPKSIRKNLFSSDLKTNQGNYLHVKSLNPDCIDGADITQVYRYSEIPKLDSSSDSAILTHYTRPVNIETGFQTQEISVVKMASLLKNSEIEAELREESIVLGGVSPQSNITSSPGSEQKKIHKLRDKSAYETSDLLNGGFFPTYASSYPDTADTSKNIDNKLSASFVPKSFDPLVCGVLKEHEEIKSTNEGLGNEDDSETLCRDMNISMNSDIRYEPLSGDSDQGSFGDCRNPKLDMEDSCTLRYSHIIRENARKDDYDTFMSLNNCNSENRGYSAKVPGLETNIPPRNWSTGIKKEDKCVPYYIQIRDLHGITRTYPNFTITKELKDTRRTLHSLRKHSSFTAKCGLISSWTSTWQAADDITQNTLDLEYLRFAHKLKQIVKTGAAQHFASSTNVFPKESPVQTATGAFPLTKMSQSPVLHPAVRSRSPLLVTVVHSEPRQANQQMISHTPGNLNNSSSFWKETCSQGRSHLPNSERNQIVSFHLNKLKYNSTLKESRNDISLILNEYAEFNKVMLNSNQVVFQDKELNVASGESTSQEMYSSFSRRSASYEDMITDLCTNLHVKLKSVMKEACKSTFLFYLVETEDKSFFVKTKNILRKGGHTEIEPQHFCQAFHRENDTLIVIIRNDDISSHLHQIPSLLKLKHLPSVIFAGVDSPEDVLDCTYQELFRTGGFVVSDDKILETLTLVQLKEIIKILEKLNGNGRWKWLLHHRENKKLKEDVRADSIAHKKNLMLKSCQSANIIELLHYHQCDSRSSTKAENFKCLINLQIQYIDARFAVFLTDKPAVSREVFENSGILVTDVNNFIENIQKVAAPFRSSYW